MARSLRPSHADDLGLRRALSDRLLPLLVAAMTFLAALALAGAMAAAGLSQHWRGGAARVVTVQVPDPAAPAAHGGTRSAAAARALIGSPGVAVTRQLGATELGELLRPWLGLDAAGLSLHLPAVFEVRVNDIQAIDGIDAALKEAAPGTLVERNGAWLERLTRLASSLQACAALGLLVVAFVASSVVALATRAGLAARRDAIVIVHGLGATDGLIAGRFAGRISLLAFGGSLFGVLLVLPVLISLARLSAPFQPGDASPDTPERLLAALPDFLWIGLAALPAAAGLIGWGTTQVTVRAWLGRLP